MTIRPTSIDDLADAVTAHTRLRIRGGGTKPALSSPTQDETVLDMRGLAGIVEYRPEECTFTARAGTPVVEIEQMLAPHGQHLPFDPPLADAGATIGGTVAAGMNGSCRYRFGGVRDFIIGARLVDGRGRIVTSGGKVVKNAAGFLLHQALVGSCGRLGAIAELTFKVFPAAEAHATLRVDTAGIAAAAALVTTIERARFDLEALDIGAPGTVWARLGGFREALSPRISTLERVLGAAAPSGPTAPRDVVTTIGNDEEAVWRDARTLSWVPRGDALVRIPTTLGVVAELDAALAAHAAQRRYAVAGNVALVAWPGHAAIETIDGLLRGHGLVGQVLRGPVGRSFIGALRDDTFELRLKGVLDPDGRF